MPSADLAYTIAPPRWDEQYITTLNPNDVLFGRGSGPNDHEGNVAFRVLVSARKDEYMATNHRQTKANIAREIVDSVIAKGGRFLKKVGTTEAKRLGVPKGVDAWCWVDDETIMEKAKQALRQNREKGKGDDNDTPKKPVTIKSANPPPVEIKMFPPYDASSGPYPSETMSDPHGMLQSASHRTGYSQSSRQRQQEDANLYEPYQYPPATGTVEPQPLDWCAEPDPLPLYAKHSMNAPSLHTTSTRLLMGEDPPPQQHVARHRQAEAEYQQRIIESNNQRIAEMNAQHIANLHSPRNSTISDDADRRESLQISDLMISFDKMRAPKDLEDDEHRHSYESTETMGTIGRFNGSSDTMGTIEPLALGASNISMSSSTFSIFKGALSESARSSLSRGGSRQDSQRRFSQKSAASDMSLSLSQVDLLWGESSSNKRSSQVSKVLEGLEDDEDNSKTTVGTEPRPVSAMNEDPDSLSRLGQSSMSIVQELDGDSSAGDSTLFSGDIHGESSQFMY